MDTRRLLDEFPAYLEGNRLARVGQIPYVQRWAQRYIAALADPALAPDDRLRVFLASLAHSTQNQAFNARGHNHVETTMIYTHVLRQTRPSAASPLDELPADPAGVAADGQAQSRSAERPRPEEFVLEETFSHGRPGAEFVRPSPLPAEVGA